jgi:hypothetical protein
VTALLDVNVLIAVPVKKFELLQKRRTDTKDDVQIKKNHFDTCVGCHASRCSGHSLCKEKPDVNAKEWEGQTALNEVASAGPRG